MSGPFRRSISIMEKITDVRIEKIFSSEYVRPIRMHYKQDGKQRKWDLMRVHDSVAILLYHRSRNCLVFVKQFRPAVYLNRIPVNNDDEYNSLDFSKYPASTGCTYEMCAGIVDKKKTLAEIAREEIQEECGYDVPLDKLEKITSCRSGVGVSSAKQTMYYAEIDDTMQISQGGGDEHEMIDVIYVPVQECKNLLFDEEIQKGPGLMFCAMWFFERKAPRPEPNAKI